jgi:hypothetical protein
MTIPNDTKEFTNCIIILCIIFAGLVKESELNLDSVILGVPEFLEGIESFRPSITEEELAYYESLSTQM